MITKSLSIRKSISLLGQNHEFKMKNLNLPFKSKILSHFVNKSWIFPLIAIFVISFYIIFILLILLTPLIKTPLYTQQDTIYSKTIYPEEFYNEKIDWAGLNWFPYSEIYVSLQTDRDVYLYIFNQNQYLHYLERKAESLSITNLDCIASIKDKSVGHISMILEQKVNPLYIIIDTNGASTEVEINSLTYRYTLLERSWYLWTLIIFVVFLIVTSIAFYIKRKYNPWNYFHPLITENAYKKFKDGHYDDCILSVFNEIEPMFKTIAKRRGHGFKYGWKAIELLMDEKTPIIRLADISSEEGEKTQKDYKLLFQANFSLNRNPIAHNNMIFQKYEALRQLGILDELIKIIETGKIVCNCGSEVGFFEYIDNHNH